MSFFSCFFLIVSLVLQLTPSCAKPLRANDVAAKFPDLNNGRDLFFSGNRLELKNICNANLKIHMRYNDGGLKYAVSNNARKDQIISVPTENNVVLVLVAAERSDSKDIFQEKCNKSERNYIRYSDGLCYKIFYSTDVQEISCESDLDFLSSKSSSNLRKLPGTPTIVKVGHQPRF